MRVKVIKASDSTWYKIGEIFEVKDKERYSSIGVQVVTNNRGVTPDVIAHGDYVYLT